jgi:hypothetical protein
MSRARGKKKKSRQVGPGCQYLLNRIGISFFLVTKSRTGSTARCWERSAVELTSGDGDRWRDDVWAVEKLLLRHF